MKLGTVSADAYVVQILDADIQGQLRDMARDGYLPDQAEELLGDHPDQLSVYPSSLCLDLSRASSLVHVSDDSDDYAEEIDEADRPVGMLSLRDDDEDADEVAASALQKIAASDRTLIEKVTVWLESDAGDGKMSAPELLALLERHWSGQAVLEMKERIARYTEAASRLSSKNLEQYLLYYRETTSNARNVLDVAAPYDQPLAALIFPAHVDEFCGDELGFLVCLLGNDGPIAWSVADVFESENSRMVLLDSDGEVVEPWEDDDDDHEEDESDGDSGDHDAENLTPTASSPSAPVATCVRCGTENNEDSRFCTKCGTPLWAFCTKCGTRLAADAKHCSNCGAHIATANDPAPQDARLPHREAPDSASQAQATAPIPQPSPESLKKEKSRGWLLWVVGIAIAAAYLAFKFLGSGAAPATTSSPVGAASPPAATAAPGSSAPNPASQTDLGRAPEPSAGSSTQPVEPAASTPVSKPSFDCAKASTDIERLICSEAQLARLDSALAEAYSSAQSKLESQEARDALKSEQLSWMRVRNQCADAACVSEAYESRLKALGK